MKITSGLGEGEPVNIIVLPVLFEDQVLGGDRARARSDTFSEIHLTFLEQLMETIGVVLNTLIANMRTEELLAAVAVAHAGAAEPVRGAPVAPGGA